MPDQLGIPHIVRMSGSINGTLPSESVAISDYMLD